MPSTQGRRGMGAVSSFNFGRAAGVVHGALAALGFQINFVRPTEWKKYFGLSGKDKHASIAMAKNLYPEAAELLTRKKDHGRAEAILIAAYGRHHNER
jgi:crossover junction endodeoxyribonuclease RuvC